MKPCIRKTFVRPVLVALGSVLAGHVAAQTFTTLQSLAATAGALPGTNSGGAKPDRGWVLSGDSLYGIASSGGAWGYGAVFAVNTNGTGFTTLYDFSQTDGSGPHGSLIASDHTLYGTRNSGGLGNGTGFGLPGNGTVFTPKQRWTVSGWPHDIGQHHLRYGVSRRQLGSGHSVCPQH